jgi:hypothetical protein
MVFDSLGELFVRQNAMPGPAPLDRSQLKPCRSNRKGEIWRKDSGADGYLDRSADEVCFENCPSLLLMKKLDLPLRREQNAVLSISENTSGVL